MCFLALNFLQLESILNLHRYELILHFLRPIMQIHVWFAVVQKPCFQHKAYTVACGSHFPSKGTSRSAPTSAWRDSCAHPPFLRRWSPTINLRAELSEARTIEIGPICIKDKKILDDKWRWSMALYLTHESLQVCRAILGVVPQLVMHFTCNNLCIKNPKALKPGISLSGLALHFREQQPTAF